MLTASVDLRNACDLVRLETQCDFLQLREIPTRNVGLLSGLYSRTENAVKCGGGVSSSFPEHAEVRQGCAIDPSLLNTRMDWVRCRIEDPVIVGRLSAIRGTRASVWPMIQ